MIKLIINYQSYHLVSDFIVLLVYCMTFPLLALLPHSVYLAIDVALEQV